MTSCFDEEIQSENTDLTNEDDDVIRIFNTVKTIGQEISTEHELLNMIKAFVSGKKPDVFCYDGFEPSGRMHIAQGLIRSINTNKLTSCGFKFKFWVADIFAQMNLKFDGDLNKIRKAGELMIHMWKACGMNMTNVEFIWASDSIISNPGEYLRWMMDIATKFNLNKIKKCTTIMGKSESDDLMCSQIFYPVMQCADIFHLQVDICSLGLDQRKVNMLARDYSSKTGKRFSPIIVSHHMLIGLDGTNKMSKSKPNNAIFMDDTPHDVKKKINSAFCEEGNIECNPILEYFKFIVFELKPTIVIDVLNFDTKTHTNVIFESYDELESSFVSGNVHPRDIKFSLIKEINELLAPVQKYIQENREVQKLIVQVKQFNK